MKRNKSFRNIILKIHEVLGLTTGVVVFVVAITGCMWVFKDEIESLYSDYKYVVVKDQLALTPTESKQIAQKFLPGKEVHGVLYGKASEAIEVIYYELESEFYQSIFLDPYSGKILHHKDHTAGFFGFVLEGHVRLWLPHQIGEHLVRISILLFMVMLISGLILWWPKNKKNRTQRFRFVWNLTTRWKRKNFDLHTILGFYLFSLAFILAFTGSVMAYDWFYHTFYKSLGGEKTPYFYVPTGSQIDSIRFSDSEKPIDQVLAKLQLEKPEAVNFEIHYPHDDSSAIYVEVSNSKDVYYNSDYLYYDQNTLEEISTSGIYGKYEDAYFADKVVRMNYDIHVGAIGGIAGKIIAFLSSLLIASLPVTGFLIWLGRRRKVKHVRPFPRIDTQSDLTKVQRSREVEITE